MCRRYNRFCVSHHDQMHLVSPDVIPTQQTPWGLLTTWYVWQQTAWQGKPGRGSNGNRNYPNIPLRGFAAAKSTFPVSVQGQPCPVGTALQRLPCRNHPSIETSCSKNCWIFFFFYLCFPFDSWSNSGSEALSCKQIKLISHTNSSAELRPHIFYSEYLLRVDASTTGKPNGFIRTVCVQQLSIGNQSSGQ